MDVREYAVSGPLLIKPKVFGDARGFFVERYREDLFREIGIQNRFLQDNHSRSAHRVLRGLHYQFDQPQGKLVTAIRGQIQDVVVDLRSGSPTFGQSVSVVLDGDRPEWFWVPAGFAHGFAVLSQDGADVMYKVDAPYNPKGEAGIAWNDPELKIDWQVMMPLLSEKDQRQPLFREYQKAPQFHVSAQRR